MELTFFFPCLIPNFFHIFYISDFIGPYTLLKMLENKGKMTLRGGKESTVLPPDEYRDRFRNAMEQVGSSKNSMIFFQDVY